jgi:hypothetical protein
VISAILHCNFQFAQLHFAHLLNLGKAGQTWSKSGFVQVCPTLTDLDRVCPPFTQNAKVKKAKIWGQNWPKKNPK